MIGLKETMCWDVQAAAMEFPCPNDHFELLCASTLKVAKSPFCFIFVAENPTMMELVNFPSSGCKLNLAVEVGDHYFRFGTLLLEDTDGSRINAFESELLKNAEKINQRIFTLWLKGMGKKPVTWSTLIGVLQELGLDKLAKIITNAKQ